MEANCHTPPPINFNCWKHHAGFIAEQINSVIRFGDIEKLKECLLRIGESQMDLYFGKYSPKEIAEQILISLRQNRIFESEQYKKWLLQEAKDYRRIELKDKSVWILRLGDGVSRYVHIHPGRYSPHTLRVKATTLKTVTLALCSKSIVEGKEINTETVNIIRKKYLDEPPLKSISKASGFTRLLHHFQNVKN